jgi:DNA (cytosine-5)-methyltransferase 1
MKVLNLYACLGGNRLLWEDCEVTAVELDPELARMYQERFPNDNVIVADAHQYLLDHYKEFDFVWTSPPCPSHSSVRISQKNRESFTAIYPDMKLYEEIIFLQNYFTGKFVVENVIPFYEPLIAAKKRGRHLYWTNFNLPTNVNERLEGKGLISTAKDEVNKLCKFHKIDKEFLDTYSGKQSKVKIVRNLVDYQVGLTIFNTMRGIKESNKNNQVSIFDELPTLASEARSEIV